MGKIDTTKLQVSNSQLLDGLAQTSLSTIEYLTKLKDKEDRMEVDMLIKPITPALKVLDSRWDPKVASQLTASLSDLQEAYTSKDFHPVYEETMKQVYDTSSNALNIYKQNEEMLSIAESEIKTMRDDTSALKQRSMDVLDIIEDAAKNKSIAASMAKDNAMTTNSQRLTNMLNETEMIQMALKLDAKNKAPGVQVALEDLSGQMLAEKLGLSKLSEDDTMTEELDYFLPEDMRLNIQSYEDAKTWLNKWEADNYNKNQTRLDNKTEWEETRVFDFVEQLQVSNIPVERQAYQMIVDSLFGDEDDKKSNVAVLENIRGISPELAEKVDSYSKELEKLYPTGKYSRNFDAINPTKDLQERNKLMTAAQEEQRADLANTAVANIEVLNQSIKTVNYVTEVEANTSNLNTAAGAGRVDVLKRGVVRAAKNLIEDDYWVKGLGSAANHPIQIIRNSNNTSEQFTALKKLADTYIGPNNSKLKMPEVLDIWDGEAEQADIFYNLLLAFKPLELLNPNPVQPKRISDIGEKL